MPEKNYVSPLRSKLMKRTQDAEKMIKNGFNGTHNQAILQMYRAEGLGTTFRTMNGWNQAGYMIEKGQKALPLWGKPRKRKKDENGKERKPYFPVVMVFSEKQVFKVNEPPRNATPPQQPQTAKTTVNI